MSAAPRRASKITHWAERGIPEHALADEREKGVRALRSLFCARAVPGAKLAKRSAPTINQSARRGASHFDKVCPRSR